MNNNFIVKNTKKKVIVDSNEFLKLKSSRKKEEIENILKKLSDEEIRDLNILSSLEVFTYQKNDSIEFNNIKVSKKDKNVIFEKKNKLAFLWRLLFFLISLLLCLFITIYWTSTYYKKINDNKNNKTCDKCKKDNEDNDTINTKIDGDNSTLNITSGSLLITYQNNTSSGVIPDDMKDSTPIKESTITIENTSDSNISYDLVWNIKENNFESNNFKYILTSTNGGANTDLQTVPKTNETIVKNVFIKANSKQIYTLCFRLVGINKPQDEDQNKTFNGLIDVKINN